MTMAVVVTWNINGGRAAKNSRRTVAESLDEISAIAPDIIALQEVEFDEHDAMAGVTAEVADVTKCSYIAAFPLSPSQFSDRRRLGVVLLSRGPLTEIRRIMLPNPRLTMTIRDGTEIETHDKGLVAADLRLDGTRYVAASLHSFSFHRFGRSADDPRFDPIWGDLAGAVDRMKDGPLLLAGDLNTENRTLLTSKLRARSLTSATQGSSTRPSGKSHDDILFSSEITLSRIRAVETFSDHHMVVAEFSSET